MKVYICISETMQKFAGSEQQRAVKSALTSALKKYYGSTDVEITVKPNIGACEVYVMGTPKYEGYELDIRNCIIDIIKNTFVGIPAENITVKMNYAAFNPTFNPMKSGNIAGDGKGAGNNEPKSENTRAASSEYDYERLSYNYHAEEPRYSFEQVILPESVKKQIEEVVGIIKVERKVFDDWGLRAIVPQATSALSFYGPPGTGKSMAAEAVAKMLGKKILCATYADIESKFHGEGPKMVKAIFRAAEREDAVLFIDESDSLLSKRLTNVSDGSAQAINSMRSQLLISLERFKGIVIFATNLVINYDQAFLTRLISIQFTEPDAKSRKKIWDVHIKGDNIRIPLAADVDTQTLADNYKFCGREIRKAVVSACVNAAMESRDYVEQNDFIKACSKVEKEITDLSTAKDNTVSAVKAPLTEEQKNVLKEKMQKKLDELSEK